MFEQMVSALKNGTFPDTNLLRKRFAAALVKKNFSGLLFFYMIKKISA
ncbi:MAG: hypothetical protein P8Y08_12315 [Desulfobulbaceae bacterium]